MRQRTTLIRFFVPFVVLAIAHALATEYYLYFRYPLFDVPMHFLGGVCVVFGALLIPLLGIRLPERYFQFLPLLTLTLIVGLVWELFEIHIGIPLIQDDFGRDMVGDLFFDLLGGATAYWFAYKRPA
jgi:hypothetical protein